jgi:hypothetical protein
MQKMPNANIYVAPVINHESAFDSRKRADETGKLRHPKEGRFLISHSMNHPLSAQRTAPVAHSRLMPFWVQQRQGGIWKRSALGELLHLGSMLEWKLRM